MQAAEKWWHWWEQWWRVPQQKNTGWSREKIVAWTLALVSLAWAFATSYFATRYRLAAQALTTQESRVYE